MDASGLQTYDPGPMVSSQEGIVPPTSSQEAYNPYPQSPGHEAYKASPQSPGHDWVQTHSYRGSPVPPESKEERTILGMRIATCVLSILLVLVIIIAAVAGGVGGSMAVSSAREEAQASASAAIREALESGGITRETVTVTATVTTTAGSGSPTSTSSEFVAPTTGMLPLDCPNMSDSTHSVQMNGRRWNFEAECGVDIRGPATSMMVIAVYSFNDCMRACASLNHYALSNECVAVAFTQDLGVIQTNYGTCWLKNSTGTRFQFEEERRDTRIVARLVDA